MGHRDRNKPGYGSHDKTKVKIITDKEGNRIDGEIVDLTEKDPKAKEYKRNIVKTLDPYQYNINVAEYFLAQGA